MMLSNFAFSEKLLSSVSELAAGAQMILFELYISPHSVAKLMLLIQFSLLPPPVTLESLSKAPKLYGKQAVRFINAEVSISAFHKEW